MALLPWEKENWWGGLADFSFRWTSRGPLLCQPPCYYRPWAEALLKQELLASHSWSSLFLARDPLFVTLTHRPDNVYFSRFFRQIAGPPWVVLADGPWRTPTIDGMVQYVRQTAQLGLQPMLADLLEENGFTDWETLLYLRCKRPCYVCASNPAGVTASCGNFCRRREVRLPAWVGRTTWVLEYLHWLWTISQKPAG